METMPKIFKAPGHGKSWCITDCSEVFIERPKKLDAQAVTWSDYKSHNMIKLLIGISQQDRFVCCDSEFFECLDSSDQVMVDRGFQITEELMMKYCTLRDPQEQGSNHR